MNAFFSSPFLVPAMRRQRTYEFILFASVVTA